MHDRALRAERRVLRTVQRIKIRPCFSAKPLRVMGSDSCHVVNRWH